MHSPTVLVGHTRNADLTRSAGSSLDKPGTEQQANPAIHDAPPGSHDATRQGAVRAALESALHAAVAAGDFVTVASLAKVLADMGDKPTDAKGTPSRANVIPIGRGRGGKV